MKNYKSIFNKEQWLPLVYVPFRIGHLCCNAMKKSALKGYYKEHQAVPMIGTMADESRMRKQGWLRTGCNAFKGKESKSQPLSFWTEQDILNYIVMFDIKIADVYGDIVFTDKNGLEYVATPNNRINGAKLHTTGCERTGCMFCGFGMHSERGETRYQRLKQTHPRQYEYNIGGGQWIDNPDYVENCPEYDGEWRNWNPERIWVPSKEGLGFGKVFEMCNDAMGKELFRWE